jgi:hypothetical protein
MPFVVCDPVPTTGVQPTKYVLTMDGGATFEVDPQVVTAGAVRLHYDVTSVSVGNHRLTVSAKNVWGQSIAVPFDFTKSVPSQVTNLGLEV